MSTLRILVIADLSGRRNARKRDPGDLASRAITEVDGDNFDRVLARIAPKLVVPATPERGPDFALSLGDLEAFTPDRLYRDLDLFRGLREMRERLADPATFAQAAAELRQQSAQGGGLGSSDARQPALGGGASAAIEAVPAAPGPTATGTSSAPAAPGPAATGTSSVPSPVEDDPATLERLLGRPATSKEPMITGPVADDVGQLIHRIVAPHVVPAADPHQAQYVTAVDAALGQRMRALLHHPDFQSLEATWRAVHWLVTTLELGDGLTLSLLDASRDEIAADLVAAGDAEASALYRRLAERESDTMGGEPWSLIVGDFAFGPGVDDVSMLSALGAIASRVGAPFVAAADCSLLGCRSLADTPDPRDWPALNSASEQRWRGLRKSPVARWIGLALPRLLLRLPYGKKGDPVDAFDFEEMAGERRHEHYLWGNPAFACACLLGQAFSEDGWDMMPGVGVDIDDLPAHTWSEDGESQMQPCAEALIGERGGQRMLELGLIPLLSYRHRNAVRVVRIASIADPAKALAGRWAEG